MRPGAKDALPLLWDWGHGCVSACERSSHCPCHRSSHTWQSALLWHGTRERDAVTGGNVGKTQSPRDGNSSSQRDYVEFGRGRGEKGEEASSCAWLVSRRPQALSDFSWPVVVTVNPSSASVSSSTKWAQPLDSHQGSTSSATWDKRLGFSEARACSSALRSLRGLW